MLSDRGAHRQWLVSLTEIPTGGTAVDLGCGRGEDLALLAEQHPGAERLLGLDAAPEAVQAARGATKDRRVEVREAALDRRLPLDDGSVDLVFSHNLLECLSEPVDGARRRLDGAKAVGRLPTGAWTRRRHTRARPHEHNL